MLVPVYLRRVNGFSFFEALIVLLVLALFMQMGIRWYEEVSAALNARTIIDRFEVLAIASYEYRLEDPDQNWPANLLALETANLINNHVAYFGNEGFDLVFPINSSDPLVVRWEITEEEKESVMQRVLSAMGGAAMHTVMGSDSWLELNLKVPTDLNIDMNVMLRDGSREIQGWIKIAAGASAVIGSACGEIPAISYDDAAGMIECSGGSTGVWRKVDLAP